MRIATWNIERLKHFKRLPEITSAIEKVNADILILTESDTRIKTGYPFDSLSDSLDSDFYRNTERRITIHSKFEIVKHHQTFDSKTSICPEVATPKGNLLVYGTIIGIHGNRRKSFNEDLEKQLQDFDRLATMNICIAGDFNMSFGDNYYYTKHGRDSLNESFSKNQVINLTAGLSEAIDHICISESFAGGASVNMEEWNSGKTLSDHKGVCVEFEF